MKRYGTYRGRVCYSIKKEEFIEKRCFEDCEPNIYLIKEDENSDIYKMVQNNRLIGYYNGSSVRDVYSENDPYYSEVKDCKPQLYRTPRKRYISNGNDLFVRGTNEKDLGTFDLKAAIEEIDFKNYTTIVDEFFKNL